MRGRGALALASLLTLGVIAVVDQSAARLSTVVPAFSFASPVRLAGAPATSSIGLPLGTEPRVAVAPNGRRFVITNDATGAAAVFSSTNGTTWRDPGSFPQPRSPSPDVDVVATRTGRLIAVELDGIGFRASVAYSDDAGATWNASRLAAFADQDRPWLAVGPDDPSTHAPTVYLMFHNLFSAVAMQEMFVSRSTDGGASFGLPVPIATPGSAAFSDLQCADSSGPSGIAVDHRTGRLYASWTTRTSPAGGCGAQLIDGLSFSVEGSDRVWVATSPDGSPGSWTTSIAVDDSSGGNVVAALFAPMAVDRAGNVYVAYPETPRAYPDYSGAAIRYRWAPPSLSRWSRPVTVVPAGGPGNLLAHVVAGDRGKLVLAYLSGASRPGASIGWYATAAQVLDALGSRPHATRVRLAAFPAYTGTANDLAGACGTGPGAGLKQGLLCPRAADNFGLALDRACRVLVVWPAIVTDGKAGRIGTWVSAQRAGPTIC